MNISNIIIPIITLVIIIYGYYKKVDIYSLFIEGIKEGLSTTLNIFPSIFAMIVSVNVLLKSGIISDITDYLMPLLSRINIDPVLVPLCILRPISSSSSLIILNDILKVYSPDSMIGRIASIIQGSSDTTIYIISLYFTSIGIKKVGHSLLVGLLVNFLCVVISIIVVNILF